MEWTPPSSGYGTDRVCVTSDNRGCGQVKISISGHIVAHDYSPVGRSFGRWSIPKTRRRSDVITFCVEGVYERRRAACIDQAACRTFVMAAWSPPTNVELLYWEPWTIIIIIMTRRQLRSVATTLHDDRDPVPSSTPV